MNYYTLTDAELRAEILRGAAEACAEHRRRCTAPGHRVITLDGRDVTPGREPDFTPGHTRAMHALTGLGVPGPGGIYKPDAEPAPEGTFCEQCGQPGMWISGAGRVLCVRHQDQY